jgi:hypothetical protein
MAAPDFTLTLYTSPTQAACEAEKAWLRAEGHRFEERSVSDPDNLNKLVALGSRSTPTTVIEWQDGRQDLIIGFSRRELGERFARGTTREGG